MLNESNIEKRNRVLQVYFNTFRETLPTGRKTTLS